KEIAPGALKDGQVGFCNTGSEAAELSMRLAKQFNERSSIICQFGCFHGQTSMGALALNTTPHGRGYGVPLVPGIYHVPFPYCYRCQFNAEYPECNFKCVEFIEYQIKTRVIPAEQVAAFFIEPIQVHGGVIPMPNGYLTELRRICSEHGILIVADEVTTGFGRTGKMFATEHYDAEIDMMFMAKPMAAGLNLGAIMANSDIMSNFRGGGTFSGNPVACAASLANIETIQQQNILDNVIEMGSYLRKRLDEISESLSIIGDVRGMGLLYGIEIVDDNKQPNMTKTRQIINYAVKSGLLIFPAGVYESVLRLCPPLIIQRFEMDIAIDKLTEAIKSEQG
ncbi:MAG: aminotransferase class III-fold pyridoxal phosphate-dependent enzyme, partial [Candidatus Thorarchaeota archaeon]